MTRFTAILAAATTLAFAATAAGACPQQAHAKSHKKISSRSSVPRTYYTASYDYSPSYSGNSFQYQSGWKPAFDPGYQYGDINAGPHYWSHGNGYGSW